MKNNEVKGVRNIAILSHGAAGKTSLADAMVYAGGAVDIMGSVDNGTPVYINFLEETKGTLRSADGAIVIVSAISGVKAETEKIYKFACDYEISRIAFISKLDKERADFFRAVGDKEKN